MTAQRIGLVLAALLCVLGVPSAVDVGADPVTGDTTMPIMVGVIVVVIAIATLALLVPAWRGRRGAAKIIAALQLVSLLPALPAFFVPADLLPPGGVLVAAVGCVLGVTACVLIIDSSRVLLHAAVGIVVVALYASLVAVLSAVLPPGAQRFGQTVSAVVVAVAYGPVLALARRTVGRSLYGGRIDPAGTAVRLRRRLDERPPEPVAAVLTDLTQELRLRGIALLVGSRVVATAGAVRDDPRSRTQEVPLHHDATARLRVTLRPGEQKLPADDRAALELVALPVGLLVEQAELTEQLRTARAQTVEVLEQERVRVHRDLHDDLGPLLTGAVFRADAVGRLLRTGDDVTLAELDVVRTDLRAAIAALRRVVAGLRPMELEERGLWVALQARADRLGAAITLPEPRPELSAATEVATYRIVSEALTNADRYATGADTRVSLRAVDDTLDIEVLSGPVRAERTVGTGIGVRSMLLRAEELGGVAEVGPTPDGWRVHAVLPVPSAQGSVASVPATPPAG